MEPLKNVLRICDPCKKTKTRIKTILLLDNLMTFPLQITVIRIGKDSNLNFFLNFQIYPPKQHYQEARFWQISTAKFPTWYLDFAVAEAQGPSLGTRNIHSRHRLTEAYYYIVAARLGRRGVIRI